MTARLVIIGAGPAGLCAAGALRQRAHLAETVLVGRQASARSIDRAGRTVILADGRHLAYDRLLLATGTRPRPLPFTSPNIAVLRRRADGPRLAQAAGPGQPVAVLGGSLAGLEAAAAARGRGCPVTLLEPAGQLMADRLPAAVAARLAALHRRHGVDVRLGAVVAAIEGGTIRLAGGGRVEAALILAASGEAPETALAEAAGLAVRDGIITDAYCRTSDPAIFAAGGCARQFNPFAGFEMRARSPQDALDQAAAAARNMAAPEAAAAHAPCPWTGSAQFGLDLQICGAGRPEDELVWRGDTIAWQRRAGRLTGAIGLDAGPDMDAVRQVVARNQLPDWDRLADSGMPPASL